MSRRQRFQAENTPPDIEFNSNSGNETNFRGRSLSRSAFSINKKPILGIAAIEVLGATLLGNFYTILDKASDELEAYYINNSSTVERPTVRW